MSSSYTNLRPEIQALIPTGINSLLDVGCGAGIFGKAIKDKLNCEVWGIEPVEGPAREARKVLDQVVLGLFDEAANQIHRTFDIVCFNDVLEHMPDPESCLVRTQQLLSKQGLVIASMPNILHYQEFFDILRTRDFKYSDEGVMDKTHLRFFTKKSMIRMFEKSGYEVVNIKGLDPTPSKKMTLISLLSFGYLKEMRYPQFVVVARVKKS